VAIVLLTTTAPSATTILATFDVAPLAATVEDADDWTVTPMTLEGEVAILSAVIQVDPKQVLLTVTPALTAGGEYMVVAENATDGGGVPAFPKRRLATISTAYVLAASVEWPETFLRTLLHSFGRELQTLDGVPTTRLLAALGPTDIVASVESTLALPETGSGWIGRVRVSWGSVTQQMLHGLTFTAPRLHTVPAGSDVVLDPASVGVV